MKIEQNSDGDKDLNVFLLLRLHDFTRSSSIPAPFVCPDREELRRWFIAQELDLFRFRFHKESKDNVKLFLEKNDLNYDLVSIWERCTVSGRNVHELKD